MQPLLSDRDQVLARAFEFERRRDFVSARDLVEDWLRSQPDDHAARAWAGALSLAAGAIEPGLGALSRAYRGAPDLPGLARRLGGLLMELGEFERAGEILSRAWSLGQAEALDALQELLRRQDAHEIALQVSEEALAAGAGESARLDFGRMLYWNQQLEDSAGVFARLREARSPQTGAATVMEGTVRFEQHRLDEARQLFALARTHAPDNPFVPGLEADVGVLRHLLARGRAPLDEEAVSAAIASLAEHMLTGTTAVPGGGPAVVLYHVRMQGEHPLSGGTDHAAFDFDGMIREAVRSCRAWLPRAPVYLFTDQATPLAPDLGVDRVVRLPVVAGEIMYERMRTMCAFVHGELFDRHALFLDTDAVVNGDVARVFDGSFAIGLSSRPHDPLMPLNEGVIFADRDRPDEVRRFFRACLGEYQRLAADPVVAARYREPVTRWRGGQLALAAATGWPRFESTPCTLDAGGATVRVFPVTTHNFPYPAPGQVRRECAQRMAWDRLVVHFKGRKQKTELAAFVRDRLAFLAGNGDADGTEPQAARELRRQGRPWAAARLLEPMRGDARVAAELAAAWRDLDRPQRALDAYRSALATTPGDADLHWDYGLLLLSCGELAAGWDEYEWGLRAGTRFGVTVDFTPPDQPVGGGAAMTIVGEQGIGDEIMFASCLADVQTGAPGSVVHCNPRLQPLFARSFPGLDCRGWQGIKSAEDLAVLPNPVPIGSLPRRLRRSLDEFPPRRSYLVAEADAVRGWQRQLRAARAGRTVGLSWLGGRSRSRRTQRSIPLPAWREAFGVPGVNWINVQYGATSQDVASAAETGARLYVPPGIDPLEDMDGFAALLSALDLVITVDNSTAHLAGALGVETWLLLPAPCEWRWFRGRADSPWYPSVRLYRQPRPGDWRSVLEAVTRDLQARTGG